MAIDPATRAEILKHVERLAREKVAPRAAEIDRSNAFPRDLYGEAGRLGLFGLWVPEEYGGIGPDLVTPLLVCECLSRASLTFALNVSNCGDAVTPIVLGGTEAAKRKFLPDIASGAIIPAFALSEPGGGSDAAAITTRAVRDGDDYVISGRKMWCTNGSVADVCTVFAKTDPQAGHKGVSAFVVPKGLRGFEVGQDEELMGLRGSPTSELIFDEVRVPAAYRLGGEGEGFKLAMATLDEARLNCSALAIGGAIAAFGQAVAYAKERRQFGKPIIEHQGLAFLLAEAASDIAAGRAIFREAIELLERGRSHEASTYAAMSKLVTSDMAMRVATQAVQVLGGNGLSRKYPVERIMRDVKAFQIFDGTNEIQKMVIGRNLAKWDLPFDEFKL
ncbi:acyl-CoA dehydrogenase [Hypericibacter adhaerens]|jgi:acyl-CoA dehydrogenase|uniref:Cyclohexane-1-carbonyl-CoA dehydrogenase n=1 Tax=Hypericibacter adhaerens TaxID=2602016 RepID=A0A5J6MRA5_9PROT|nr:acyl-CoA dehydrogenase family protein [Hypericibacter adhaerens]QEX20212.1 acyl-CoA dehydrogenase [Hypericibacter adhaerens]